MLLKCIMQKNKLDRKSNTYRIKYNAAQTFIKANFQHVSIVIKTTFVSCDAKLT